MARRLDYWAKADTFKWLDEREDAVFQRYVTLGKYQAVVRELAAQCNGLSEHTFYAWLHATDERWERWQDTLELRGHISAGQAEEIAENATQQDANASRLKYEAKMKAAEWQNRAVFGKRPEVQLAIGVGDEWAKALAQALEPQTVRAIPVQDALAERPTPTEHSSARALGPGTVLGTGSSGEPEQASGMEVQSSGELSHDP